MSRTPGGTPRVPATAALAALAPLAVAAACTAAPAPAPTPQALVWSTVSLPQGASPLVLATSRDRALVGATAGGRPALLVLDGGTHVRGVPLIPHGVYAQSARWVGVAVDGDHVVGLGRATGGAHGLPRWTVWDGSPAGVEERPQPFETFGGPRAGGLAAVTTAAGGDVAVGTWDEGGPGLDGTLWLRSRDLRWSRQPSTGSPLASTSRELVQVASVAALVTGPVVVVGSVTDLSGVRAAERPAAWTAPGPRGPWTRHDLPATTPSARSTGVECAPTGCWVVGTDGDAAALWHLTGGPTLGSADAAWTAGQVALPTSATGTAAGTLVAVAGTAVWVVVRLQAGAVLLRRDATGRWSSWAPPQGDVHGLGWWAGHLGVVSSVGGATRLLVAAIP